MMAVSFIDAVAAQDGLGWGGSPTIAIPATAQNGDLLIAACFYTDIPADETFISWPSGWTHLTQGTTSTQGSLQVAISWTIKAGGTTAPTWGLTNPAGDAAYNKTVTSITVYRGAGTPVLGTPDHNNTSTTAVGAPSMSGANTSVGLSIHSARSSSFATGFNSTPPTGKTLRLNHVYTAGGGHALLQADENFSGGAVPARTANTDVAVTDKYGVHIEIPDASAGGSSWTISRFVRLG